ncbi:MAG: GtrA family protein [Acidimicrobiales bacterium]
MSEPVPLAEKPSARGRVQAWTSGPFARYSMVSAVAVATNQVVLFISQFFFTARVANLLAVCISAVPSFQLNRRWVWGRDGRSDVMREIVPFWVLALVGLLISTWFVELAAANAHRVTSSDLGTKLVVNIAAFAGFGVLWVAKFAILNRVLFATQPATD